MFKILLIISAAAVAVAADTTIDEQFAQLIARDNILVTEDGKNLDPNLRLNFLV